MRGQSEAGGLYTLYRDIYKTVFVYAALCRLIEACRDWYLQVHWYIQLMQKVQITCCLPLPPPLKSLKEHLLGKVHTLLSLALPGYKMQNHQERLLQRRGALTVTCEETVWLSWDIIRLRLTYGFAWVDLGCSGITKHTIALQGRKGQGKVVLTQA